jgi:hypothetical protein
MQPTTPQTQLPKAEFPFFLESSLGILGFLVLICLF